VHGTATHSAAEKASIFVFAAAVLAVVVGLAFAAGWLIGRVIL
jgi:hypothetical protein